MTTKRRLSAFAVLGVVAIAFGAVTDRGGKCKTCGQVIQFAKCPVGQTLSKTMPWRGTLAVQ